MGLTDRDPIHESTRRLAEALTTARSHAQSRDGYLVVEACADGEIAIRIDDRALTYGGAAVGAELTRLAAEALAAARVQVRDAVQVFSADPRVAEAVAATGDAMGRPPGTAAGSGLPDRPHNSPPNRPENRPMNRQWPANHVVPEDDPSGAYDRRATARPATEHQSASWQDHRQERSNTPPRQHASPNASPPYNLYDVPDDDEDAYYQRKSWLE
ncbi:MULTISPECIES: hypothetical protein [Nocardia]|jgi:hypothetical protein|uniref:hypothetical protein n=1 Tax=Nocardia TaxID=1817 RepID=UPI00055F0980|nr:MULTISPECIES: hypothetical protein [Nocardia]